jgi:PadR family transcriptional regulator, regulatory protein PadR
MGLDRTRHTTDVPIVYRWKATMAGGRAAELLPGTLDLLVLRTLVRGPMHGYGIAQRVKVLSQEVLAVGESSLYPALQRLLLNGFVAAEWGTSDNNRRARYYTLTAVGRRQLAAERKEFERVVTAIHAVLELA